MTGSLKPSLQRAAPGFRALLPVLLVVALALLSRGSAQAEEDDCMDCHSGQKEKAAKVVVQKSSAHADLDCDECHVNAESPHDEEELLPVRCTGCHKDEAKALKAASHDEKLKTYLEEKGRTRGSDKCLACHGRDPHNVLSAEETNSPTNKTNVSATCIVCHGEAQTIDIKHYVDSVHAAAISGGKLKGATCTSCHGFHSIDHSGLRTSSVNHGKVPETCSQCHEAEHAEYTDSKHWELAKKGFREAPVCTDCHGEHGIRSRRDPLSPIWAGNITKTCASCHASERMTSKFMVASARVRSFKESFHGLSGELGDLRVANCSSCHGNHGIRPSSDPRSTVHPDNLAKACGQCHPGAEKRFFNEKVHTTTAQPSHWLVGLVRQFYILLIVCTIGGMLGHNLLDLVCKSTRGIPYHRHEDLSPRFSVAERVQHGLLVLSFILLALSGFALKFPNSPFSWPLQWLSDGPYLRRQVHRVAAVVFLCVGVCHFFYVIFAARGRKQLGLMLPRLRDIREVRKVLGRYLSRGNREPLSLGHYTYVEKAEYWALVWGTVVMTVTGLLLYFFNTALANLPFWAIDLALTIHYWEAVLACLAIVVWHGYWVVFDPEFYPLNLTWLIGDPRPTHDAGLPERNPDGDEGSPDERGA